MGATKFATNIPDMRTKIHAIDRITSRIHELEGEPFPEKMEASKLKMVTPAETFSYIATPAERIQQSD